MSRKERGRKLIDAVTRGDYKTVDELLSHDVDLDTQIKGDNAVHMAARTGRLRAIKTLKKKGDNLQRKNINGNTPLHYAARDGYLEIVKFLYQNDVDMNCFNNEGDTPLHLAVVLQTMDVIEDMIVQYGMDPNFRNNAGQTPLHKAVLYDRQEAMEALIICGADPNIRDNSEKGLKPEDVAKSTSIRDTLKIYNAMRVAMEHGFIKAKGLKITHEFISKPQTIDRVDIILESLDLPRGFHAAFYCRREKSENTTMNFKIFEDERTFSDIFHIKISDVNRDCKAKIYLPLYVPPSDKEIMVLRFMNCAEEDRVVEEYIVREGLNYCLLETVLVPETACICMINVRPKKEETQVSSEAQVVKSDIDESFNIDIPAGAFAENTVISLQVFEASPSSEVFDSEEECEDENPIDEQQLQLTSTEPKKDETRSAISLELSTESSNAMIPTETNDSETTEEADTITSNQTAEGTNSEIAKEDDSLLLATDVYQINVIGQQPNKNVLVQIPLSDGQNIDDVVVLNADENNLHADKGLEILPQKPKLVNMNLIFEVSHFCLYFGAFKSRILKKEEKMKLQREISSCREQRYQAIFFAMVRKVEDDLYRHIVVVECCRVSKVLNRRKKWAKKGFRDQEETENTGRLELIPDEEFFVDIKGNTELKGDVDAIDRKMKFSGVRSCYKHYEVSLERDAKDGSATVLILTKTVCKTLETVKELPILLELPPPPTPPLAPTRQKTVYRANKDEAMKNYPSCAQS